MSERAVLFRLEGISVTYEPSAPERPPTAALRCLSLAARVGDFVLVSGQNGSGKSTLLGVLAGRVPVTTGRCRLYDSRPIDPRELPRNLSVCTVFQDQTAGIVPGLTVADHLAFRLLAARAAPGVEGRRRGGPATRGEALKVALDRLRRIPILAYLAERHADEAQGLSGGWKQVLQVAACVLAVPDIVLLDEPTSHLSETNRPIVEQLIAEHAQSRLVVLVSHAATGESISARVNVRWNLHEGALTESPLAGASEGTTEP